MRCHGGGWQEGWRLAGSRCAAPPVARSQVECRGLRLRKRPDGCLFVRSFDLDDPLCPEVRRQLLIWASKTEPGEQRTELQESAAALACAEAPNATKGRPGR